jgi:hypothetical protein
MGGAVGKSFVVTGIVVSGSGDVAVVEDGGLLMGFADSDDTGVGGLSVTVADEAPVGASGLLVGVSDESVERVGGVDWVTGSWDACGALGVATCWLHPIRNKPASALAAAIWIFCNDFIFVIPLFKPTFPI